MPINLTPYISDTLCHGHTWTISDEDLLAQMVAKILMGRQLHVAKILSGINVGNVNFSENVINDAIDKLTLDIGEQPYHRDGLIFQIFSWIAAHKSKGINSILRAPHLIPAQKGFDGLQIDINNGNIEGIVIFEDKATESPRGMIREQVWPEFKEFYEGQRESELQQEISSMLVNNTDVTGDLEEAIETIFWDKARKFRVAITAKGDHMNEAGRARLFKGYAETIPSSTVDFRKADCVYLHDLRNWMEKFSVLTVLYLNSYRDNNDV